MVAQGRSNANRHLGRHRNHVLDGSRADVPELSSLACSHDPGRLISDKDTDMPADLLGLGAILGMVRRAIASFFREIEGDGKDAPEVIHS